MPILAVFYGIIIKMYFMDSEHNPPYIYASYGEYGVAITILDCKVLKGYLPNKAYKMVCEWIEIHRKELIYMWENQEFKKLPP